MAQFCLTVVMGDRLTWYDGEVSNNSPWLNALAELRQRATREGYCYQHAQAITIAIDKYAEKALGNRDYFLNKPLRRRLSALSKAALSRRALQRPSTSGW